MQLESSDQESGRTNDSRHFCILDINTLKYLTSISDELDEDTLSFGPRERALRYDSEGRANLYLKIITTFFPAYTGRLQLSHI